MRAVVRDVIVGRGEKKRRRRRRRQVGGEERKERRERSVRGRQRVELPLEVKREVRGKGEERQ